MKKRYILPIVAVAFILMTANTMRTKEIMVKAEDTSVLVDDSAKEGEAENGLQEEEQKQEEVLDEESVVEEVKEWFENQYNSFVLPLISGLSITTIVGMAVSVSVALLNRKNHQKQKITNEELQTTATNVLTFATDLITEIIKNNSISEETRKKFIEVSDDLTLKLGALTDRTEKLLEMKNHLYTIASLLNEIASNTKEFVANGVAEKCNRLLEEIKSI